MGRAWTVVGPVSPPGPGPASPALDPNPNYHSPEDLTVDSGYAADITRR